MILKIFFKIFLALCTVYTLLYVGSVAVALDVDKSITSTHIAQANKRYGCDKLLGAECAQADLCMAVCFNERLWGGGYMDFYNYKKSADNMLLANTITHFRRKQIGSE